MTGDGDGDSDGDADGVCNDDGNGGWDVEGDDNLGVTREVLLYLVVEEGVLPHSHLLMAAWTLEEEITATADSRVDLHVAGCAKAGLVHNIMLLHEPDRVLFSSYLLMK